MSELEEYGLRGPVRICTEETIYPGVFHFDGTRGPDITSSFTIEFDSMGHLTERRIHNSDGSEWVTRSAYDPSGRLLTITSGTDDEPTTNTIYSYADDGRLLTIKSSTSAQSAVFSYDAGGRKTKVQTSTAADYGPNLAVAASPIWAADRAPNLPGGGTATTIYDEHDRPIYVVVRDSDNAIVSWAIATYDEQGRVLEEHTILDNVETIIPAESRARILQESGTTLAELRQKLTKVMGGHTGPVSIAYTYDEKGRLVQTRRRVFNDEATIETSYNENGDKSQEITQEKRVGNQEDVSGRIPPMSLYSEVRYSYEYDETGNWTSQVTSFRNDPTGEFQPSSQRRRSLSYY